MQTSVLLSEAPEKENSTKLDFKCFLPFFCKQGCPDSLSTGRRQTSSHHLPLHSSTPNFSFSIDTYLPIHLRLVFRTETHDSKKLGSMVRMYAADELFPNTFPLHIACSIVSICLPTSSLFPLPIRRGSGIEMLM